MKRTESQNEKNFFASPNTDLLDSMGFKNMSNDISIDDIQP